MNYSLEVLHDYEQIMWSYRIIIKASWGTVGVVFGRTPQTIVETMREYDVPMDNVHITTSIKRIPIHRIA